MADFNSSNSALSSLIVCVYNVGLAIGPLILAPVSEMHGRMVTYHFTNILLTIFTAACALSPNLSCLIVFRMLAGMQASTVITLGGATVSDLFAQEERGRAMALWTFGPLLGPAIGPVIGGYLTQLQGWRWVFWVVAIGVSALFWHLCHSTARRLKLTLPGRCTDDSLLFHHERNICSSHSSAKSRPPKTANWQCFTSVCLGIRRGQPERSHHAQPAPATCATFLLANRPSLFHFHRHRLLVPVPALCHHTRRFQQHLRLFCWKDWSRLLGHCYWAFNW